MSDGAANNGRRRLSSILKKSDAGNVNQCDMRRSCSENVEKPQKRKSKRVSFGRQTIQEIDKVSEIHRNWADSVSSDEGMSGLSDIGNLTSLKSKKSLENIQKCEPSVPPKNLSNILSSSKGFKFFDNTNLNIGDEDLKENVEVPVEPGLFARDFLRSHNLIKPDYDTNPAVTYPDVNPPGYNEIVKSSDTAPNKTAAFSMLKAVPETTNEVFPYSSKDFIQMVFQKEGTDKLEGGMPIKSQAASSNMVHEQTDETDVDMEMTTCIISRNTMADKLKDAEAGPSTDSQFGIRQDIEMTLVEPVPTSPVREAGICNSNTSVAESSIDDMEMTCAVVHSNLGVAAFRNISDVSQSTTRTASMEFTCINPKVSVAPSESCDANSPQDATDEMEFTCFVPLPSATTPSSQSESETNRCNAKSASLDLHLTNTSSQLTETVMSSNNDDMEFTCMISQKGTQKPSDDISEGQIEKSESSHSMPKLSFDINQIDSAHESTPLSKNFDSDEIVKSAFSDCAQSVDRSSSIIIDSANDSVFGQEASNRMTGTIAQVIATEEMHHSEIKGTVDIQKRSTVLTLDSLDTGSNLKDDSNQTKKMVYMKMDQEDGVHEVVAESNQNIKRSCPVETTSLPAAGVDNASQSFVHPEKTDTIPLELILGKVGLVLPKTPWSRDSVATASQVEPPNMSLASLFEMKYCTPTQNDIRESAISQIEEILGWCESRIEQMKDESCVPSDFLKSKVVQQKLEPLRDYCLARGRVYWKQTKTKLYKGLTKALDEYISTDLKEVCSKFGNAKELMEFALEEAHKSEMEPQPDAPTAEQENEIKPLDQELEHLNSEIEASKAKINISKERNNEILKLQEDVARLNKEWDDIHEENLKLHKQLEDLQRVTGRKISLETDKVLVLEFLDSTIELKVEMVEELTSWDSNSEVSSYLFKFQSTGLVSPAEKALYFMIHDWWKIILPTSTLIKSYPNLKSLKMLMKLLADLEANFNSMISTSDWIASRLVCKYSSIPEEEKLVVSFMAPRISTDGFQITFAFEQFREGNSLQDLLAVGVSPTSYNFAPGRRSWKELQPEQAKNIINHACGERICLRTAVEAILKHVDYNSKMFEKA